MDVEDKGSDLTKDRLVLEKLEGWLRDMPREWAQAIGARTALRVLPLSSAGFRDERLLEPGTLILVLASFRASFISWAALKYPGADINIRAAAGYAADIDVSGVAATGPDAHAAVTAGVAAKATANTVDVVPDVVSAIKTALDAALTAAGPTAADEVWNGIKADGNWLAHNSESKDHRGIQAQRLINERLWLEEVRGDPKYKVNFPRWVRETFDAFAMSELVRSGHWKPWVEWYRAILPNSPRARPKSAFGEAVDLKIATQPRDFWERDPHEVMADIGQLVSGEPISTKARDSTVDARDQASLAGEPVAVGPPGEEIYRYAKTLSDLDHRNDFIGIRPDVEALSTLVAINRVEPPLAIAIFGDWGSGKTFLMRKMQERVKVLEAIGSAQQRGRQTSGEEVPSDDGDEEPRYCSSILQIEFNAWHYTESNLWASLVSHILEKLQEHLTGTRPAAVAGEAMRQEPVETLLRELETARAARAAAEHEVQLAKDELTRSQKAVVDAEKQANASESRLANAHGQNLWHRLDELLRAQNNSAPVEAFRQALNHFGFKDSLESARTVYDTVNRFRSVSGRATQVLGSLLTTSQGRLGAVILSLVVLAVSGAAAWFNVPLVGIASAFAGVLLWLADCARRAEPMLDAVQAFDEWFAGLREQEESKIAREVATATAEFEQRKDALSAARRQLAEAEAREALATTDLQRLTARDQMRRFVDQRVTAQTYAQHLGLISMIRRDFEDLSDFMLRDQQAGEARLVTRIGEELQRAIPTVDRIVLYIDDLDRCQPTRVVEVLEAIHLLLAFRLFIVVVAVDPRWVLESLKIHYPHLEQQLSPARASGARTIGNDIDVGLHGKASTHDYLEKIFHIPFWVKPMGPAACRDLIAGFLGYPRTQERTKAGESELAERFDALVIEPTARQSAVTERPLPLPAAAEPSSPAAAVSKASGPSSATVERYAKEKAAAERKIELVEISEAERAFIEDLAPYIGNSPRRIKRYANTFRLLKSGLSHAEAEQFAGDGAPVPAYRLVLILLAIVTGAPTLAPAIFTKAFELRHEFDADKLMREAGLEVPTIDPIEAASARGALGLLAGTSLPASELETWVPRVMRYAFRLTPVDVALP
jgi:KAP family P-loop domain